MDPQLASSSSAPGATSGVFQRLLAERYIVEGHLGEGTHGVVFRGTDMRTSEPVALKRFRGDAAARDTFLNELSVLLDLEHTHIARCRNLLMSGGDRWLVSELLEGGNLRELLDTRPASPLAALRHLRAAASGVEHAHGKGIVHRDLKPENILLTHVSPRATAKVVDFGVAAFSALADGRCGARAIGSPAYMAPEQFHDAHDHRVDVYALGVILHEILTGTRPFHGSPAELVAAQRESAVVAPRWLPSAAASLLEDCLAADPEARPPSVHAFRRRLDEARAGIREARQLPGWPVTTTGAAAIAISDHSVFLLEDQGRLRHLDFAGRVRREHHGVRQLVAADRYQAMEDASGWTLQLGSWRRRLPGLPSGGVGHLSPRGALLTVGDGGATFHAGRTQVIAATGGDIAAGTLFGPEDEIALARRTATGLVLNFNGQDVRLPGCTVELVGHPESRAVVALVPDAGGRRRLAWCLNGSGSRELPGPVVSLQASRRTYVGATAAGDLLTLDPNTGRTAQTGWDAGMTHVARGDDAVAWIDGTGRLNAARSSTASKEGRTR